MAVCEACAPRPTQYPILPGKRNTAWRQRVTNSTGDVKTKRKPSASVVEMARLPRTLSRSISSSVSRAALGLLQPQVYRAEEKKKCNTRSKGENAFERDEGVACARVSCVFPCKPSNELRETNKPERRRLFFSYSTFSFRTRFRLVEVFLGGVFFCETWWGVSETENFVDGRRFFFLFFRLRWFERVYLPSLGMVLLFLFFVRGHQS